MKLYLTLILPLTMAASFAAFSSEEQKTTRVIRVVHESYLPKDMRTENAKADSKELVASEQQIESETKVVDNATTNEIDTSVESTAIPEEEPLLVMNLTTGLLKVQINDLVKERFPEYTAYWQEGVDFNEEWLGEYTLTSKDRWELLNQILQSYGYSLNVKKNNVLHFNKVSG